MAISNSDDIIDSREVIARIKELEAEREASDDPEAWEQSGSPEADELVVLTGLAEEGESATSDWPYGAALIRDSYFKTYAQELSDDINGARGLAVRPFNCIDWDEAARELQMDYTAVEFDGVTYWTR